MAIESHTGSAPPSPAKRVELAFAAFAEGRGDRAGLRDAICDLVSAARLDGRAIERVIIEIKQIAAQTSLRSSRHVRFGPGTSFTHEDLVSDAVHWCVEHYFDPPH